MTVRDVANRYFSYLSAHDADGLSQLFAEDGLLTPAGIPSNKSIQGREAIRAFFAERFASTPDMSVDPDWQLIADGNMCAGLFTAQVRGQQDDGVVDIFTVNADDELVKMIAYRRPPIEE